MISPRQTILVGLLATLPAVAYGVLGPDSSALVAVVNVVVITVALYVALGPTASSGEIDDRSPA